jgi:acyl-CoA reductase-like NAD-dependent aldehyde dehydrogenase
LPLLKIVFQGILEKAIAVSQEAFSAWERVPIEEKAEIFLRAGDLVAGKYRMDLLAATMLGQAKNIMQAEIDAACELADFYRFNVEFGLVSAMADSHCRYVEGSEQVSLITHCLNFASTKSWLISLLKYKHSYVSVQC